MAFKGKSLASTSGQTDEWQLQDVPGIQDSKPLKSLPRDSKLESAEEKFLSCVVYKAQGDFLGNLDNLIDKT
jgi:hypothetical protein